MGKKLTADVVEITDGDTFKTKFSVIRLENVDAPELNEPGGSAAKQKLSSLISNEEIVYEEKARDKFARKIAQVWVNRTNVNDAMNKFLG